MILRFTNSSTYLRGTKVFLKDFMQLKLV